MPVEDSIKAVFFDHDDTLFGTIGPKWDQLKEIGSRFFDKTISDDDIRLHWGKPLKGLLSSLYGNSNYEKALAHNNNLHNEFPKILFVETIPMLKYLHSTGRKIGVITATSRFSFEADLKLHKVPKNLIDYSQTSDETEFHKPNPKVFKPALVWLQKNHIKPYEVLYVGDGLHDMQAALAANFSFLGVETGLITAEQFRKAGADSISSIAGLLPSY